MGHFDIPPGDGRNYGVDFKTVSSERFKRTSRWARFKAWFRRVILRRPEPLSSAVLVQRPSPINELFEELYEEAQSPEHLRPVRCVRCFRPITDFERSEAISVLGEGLAHPRCLPPGDP